MGALAVSILKIVKKTMYWNNLKDNLELLFNALTAFALVFAVIQIIINRKQLNLSVIQKCNTDFRNIKDLDITTYTKNNISDYIDLVNEELFYMQRGYLPKDISKEWLDGIIDYIPIVDKKTQSILNPNNSFRVLNSDSSFLIAFPRIRHTFLVSGEYDFSKIYNKENEFIIERVTERKKLIKELLKNLNKFDIYD